MKTKRIACIAVFLLLWAGIEPPYALAAGGEGWGWLGTAGRWFNLSIIVFVLVYFLRRPLGEFFRGRRKSIQAEIEEARQARALAEAKLEEVRQRMSSLDQELASLRQEAEASIETERQRLLKEAERDAERIVASARVEIGNLKRNAREELRQYAARLSVQMAEDQIRQRMGAQEEARALDRFFSELSDEGRRP